MIPTVIIPIVNNDRRDHYEHLSQRAVASVESQSLVTPYLVSYGDTLAAAKNNGVEQAGAESVMILDADDVLDPMFIEAVNEVDEWDIIKPRVYVNGLLNAFPKYNIMYHNYLINGCPVKTRLWEDVGGAEDVPYPDWHLWAKIILKHNPKVVYCRDAIYQYIQSKDGLNQQNTEDDMHEIRSLIADYAMEHAR